MSKIEKNTFVFLFTSDSGLEVEENVKSKFQIVFEKIRDRGKFVRRIKNCCSRISFPFGETKLPLGGTRFP